MSIGPFLSYVPPGVYTRTTTETNASALVAGLRIPAIIGVGQEELEQTDFELVRGSSSTVDQQIVNEDVSASWVVSSVNPDNPILGAQDGSLTSVRVRNFPIVDGQGFGRVTNDIRSVAVTVNGSPVALGAVQGQKGFITLQVPTQPDDVVRVTYFFHRGDTSFVDDVSEQVSDDTAVLTSPGYAPFQINTGLNDQFVVTVNGATATIALPSGDTLTAATLATAINAAQVANLVASFSTDNEGHDHLVLTAPLGLSIGTGSANGALGFTAGASTTRNQAFRVFQRPIVDGSGGGLITTDTSKVVVKVDGTQVVPSAVDGTTGTVTLPYAPALSATVTIQYWSNTWQDTFDYLPNTMVTNVLRCGIAAGRSDFIQGTDFVISNPTKDVSLINWGASWQVAAQTTTTGATPFDGATGSGGQISGTLIDDQLYLAPCERVTNTATIPATVSATDYYLPEIPTIGNGRNTTLTTATFSAVTNSRQGVISNRPDLIKVYTGRSLRDALNRAPVQVTSVDATTRRISLKTPQPPDYKAYATFYYSRLSDDTYTLTNKVAGPAGVGQYQVTSTALNANLYQVKFGSKTGVSQILQWPRGAENIPGAYHTGSGSPVSEVVTVQFGTGTASNASFVSRGAAPYNFYDASSQWVTKVNGTDVPTDLSGASKAVLVGKRVTLGTDGKLTVLAAPANVFKFTVDGAAKTVNLPAGAALPTDLVAAINTAAGGTVAAFKQIGTNKEGFFVLTGLATPTLDVASSIVVNQGTAEGLLGFTAFQSANGSVMALNKPATLLGSASGDFNFTKGKNDRFSIRVDGTDYIIVIPVSEDVNVTTADLDAVLVADAINAVIADVASVGEGPNADKIRLTSPTSGSGSSLRINDGTANSVLGFTQNQSAVQVPVGAQEVVNALNGTAGFASGAVAYVSSLNGQSYIGIDSLTTGATTSSVGFKTSNNSAFRSGTGVNITPGTDGDIGEDATGSFTVSSSSPVGSAGTGIPGQTYTDDRTGLRFTLLPATAGAYDNGKFTLVVSDTFQASPSLPTYAIGGLELLVSNTVGVGTDDSSTLVTYNPDGVEPKTGDFYSITYRYLKQDYEPQLYQQLKTVEANFGKVAAENRASMGAYLAMLNGAVLVIVKQVLKVANSNQASDADFNAAIDELAKPLPGNIRPDIIVPLATSTVVSSHLTSHCEIQSNIRNQAERMGFIGFASGTSPTTAQAVARSLNSSRIVVFYPDSAVVTTTDELGRTSESLVDGSMFAAAAAGAVVSPSVDVATPYDRRTVQGFTRVPRRMDPVEANQTAVAGITVVEDLDPNIRIRQGLTTNMSSILTRLPTVTQISDSVQQQCRATLDSYIGSKFLASRTNEVVVSLTALLRTLVQAEILGGFTNVNATVDPDDVSIMRVELMYAPIFPLLYILVQFNVRARL